MNEKSRMNLNRPALSMVPPAGVLSAQSLHFSYAERRVFAAWSSEFPVGLTWIQGGNGTGKSTLLKLLGGVVPPAAGRLIVREVDQHERPLDYRRQVFWCGPGAIAFDHLRMPEYFGFMRGLYPDWDADALTRHVLALGLDKHWDQRLSALSTGTQRKVWLVAAFVVNTAVVLLDEPLNALDVASLAHVREVLTENSQSTSQAWIVASHEDLGPAGQNAHRIALNPMQTDRQY